MLNLLENPLCHCFIKTSFRLIYVSYTNTLSRHHKKLLENQAFTERSSKILELKQKSKNSTFMHIGPLLHYVSSRHLVFIFLFLLLFNFVLFFCFGTGNSDLSFKVITLYGLLFNASNQNQNLILSLV